MGVTKEEKKRRFQDTDISHTEEARIGVSRDYQKSQQIFAEVATRSSRGRVWIFKVIPSLGHFVIL